MDNPETNTESGSGAEGGTGLVVIGASAGGISALRTVIASLPPDFPTPIVIAQHLDPNRKSHLADLLVIPVGTSGPDGLGT